MTGGMCDIQKHLCCDAAGTVNKVRLLLRWCAPLPLLAAVGASLSVVFIVENARTSTTCALLV